MNHFPQRIHTETQSVHELKIIIAELVTDQPLVEPVHVVILQTPSKLIGQLARLDVPCELISRDQDYLQTHTQIWSDRSSQKLIQRN